MNKFYTLVKFIIGWPVAFLSLFFVFKIIQPNLSLIIPKIIQINILLLFIGLIFFQLYFLARSILWQKMLKKSGFKIAISEAIFLWTVSELKRYTPGNIWSFLGRVVSFANKGVPKKTVLKLMLFEAQFFVIGGFIVSLLAAPLIIEPVYVIPMYSIVLFGSLVFIFNKTLFLIKPFSVLKPIIKILPNFNSIHNLHFLSLSIASLVFFGLGTYFSAISIFSLNLEHLRFLVGFFVFSLLIGYLSLITPMGLGVREGVLTFGLSKLIPLSMAGFLSIYTRFALMLSELLFLIFSVLLFKIKTLNKKVNYINKHFYELVLLCLIFIYNLYFIITTFLRHDNFYTGRFDLGNMDQVVWNTINGRIFQFTNPDGVNVMSRLSFHADFLLIFLSPLYLIWNNPKILLLIQTLAISVGAIFIYLIAKLILKNKKLALLFSFIFLLNPALQFVNLYDFHAVAFSTTFLLAASFYLIRKNIPLMLIFLFLAGITKEQIWLIVGLFGCLLAIKSYFCKKRVNANIAIGLILAFFSFSFFYYLVNFAMPLARGGEEHFALSYYSEFGESPKSIIQNVILSPDKVVETVFQKEKIDYLFQIFGPLGFLSFVSPGFLIFTIPDFLIKLLSQNKQLYQIYYQYSASVTPFVFISAIYSISYLIKKMPKMHNFLVIYLLFWSLYTAYLFGPLPGARKPNIDMYIKQQEDKLEIKKVLSIIPNESSISASNSLGAHLMHRQNIFTAPIATESADFVVLLLRSPNKDLHLINNLKQNINYKIKVEEKSIILFEKNR